MKLRGQQHSSIEFTADSTIGTILGEIKHGSPIVIFSHGFGVKRDSRGLFTKIATSLPNNFGYVLFDYNTIDGENVYLRTYSEQAAVLKTVLSMVSGMTDKIYVIGHSMGAITASILAEVNITKSILLAPPVTSSSGRKYFNEYLGAYRDKDDVLVVPRKDGTTTHVTDKFWDEAESIDPIVAMLDYSKKCDLTVIRAIDEDILRHTENYTLLSDNRGIRLVELPGNHNFDPPNQNLLIETILDILAS
jgi:pimeloyl-ACP methyl ester carboxylesterase